MHRLLALLYDYVQLINRRPVGVRLWVVIVLMVLVFLPVAELLTYQQLIALVSSTYKNTQFQLVDLFNLVGLALIILVLEVVSYYSGLKRVRLVNFLVTLQRRAVGVRDKYEGWSRAVASESILVFVQACRLLILGGFSLLVMSWPGGMVVLGIFTGIVVLFWQFKIEFKRQYALEKIVQEDKKSVSSLRLSSRIESAEKASLISALSVYITSILSIAWALSSGMAVESLLLLVLIFRFLSGGFRMMAGSLMRLSRALVGAGHDTLEEGEESPKIKNRINISRWSRLNKFERQKDEMIALKKRLDLLRKSRDEWRQKAKS